MLRKNRPKSSSIFLIELILAILFFSIAGSFCVQFFVKSHILSKRSQALAFAVNECSSIAEICRTCESAADATSILTKEYPGFQVQECLLFYFDEDFAPCEPALAAYRIELTLSEEEQMLSSSLRVYTTEDETFIYDFETSHHLQRRTSHE